MSNAALAALADLRDPTEDPVLRAVRDIEACYRDGRPILIDPESETRLTPELLLNADLALGPFDAPGVLTLVAHLDPQPETALAALARLVRLSPSPRQTAAMLALIAEKSPHKAVRAAAGLVVAQKVSPLAVAELEALAAQEADASRTRALAQIASALRVLASGEEVAVSFAETVIAAMRRAALSPPVIADILTTWMGSATASRSAKASLAQAAAKLPFDWRLKLATAANALPRDETSRALRRLLARSLEDQAAVAEPPASLAAEPAGPRLVPVPQPWIGSLRRVPGRAGEAGQKGAA
jgi:hypothetical protein